MRRRYPLHQAIVRAATIETLVDPKHSLGTVNLLCGHCGRLSSETRTLCFDDPQRCGMSYGEQFEIWEAALQDSHDCSRCGVKNVADDVETYLREEREAFAKLDDLFNSRLS